MIFWIGLVKYHSQNIKYKNKALFTSLMSFQERIDLGNVYGYMALSVAEFIEKYEQGMYNHSPRLSSAVNKFCERISSGLSGDASTPDIAHYMLARDALVRYHSISIEQARGTLAELVTIVPELFHIPSESATLDFKMIKSFFISLAELSDENRHQSTMTGKKSRYSY